MANTTVQVRRSNTTSGFSLTTLAPGEFAYSYNSSSLFIGANTTSTQALQIAGTKYGYLNNFSTPGTLAANATVIVDANSFISNTLTSGLMVTATALTPTNTLITSITNSTSSSILGANATGGGLGTELATTQAIVSYVVGKSATNVAAQYNWTNTQTFSNTITFSGATSILANTVSGNSFAVSTNFIANTTQVTISAIPLSANGTTGTAGYVLTTNGPTGSPYWAAASAGLTSAQIAANNWTWSNTQTFQNTIAFSSIISVGTSANVGNVTINTTALAVQGNTTTAPSFILTTNSATSVLYGNNTITGAPVITVQNSSTVANLSSGTLAIGNSTITAAANVVVQSNSGVSLIQVVSGTGGAAIANLSSTALTIGTSVINTTAAAVATVNATTINAATIYATTGFAGPYANITGQVNAATIYAATSANVGTAVVANATGVYTTGTVNGASFTVGTTFTANATLVNAAAVNVVGQTNTATLYAATSANVGTAVVANATGVYTTGVVNATTLQATATFTANSTLVNAAALNIVNQINTATLFVTTSANLASSNVIANTSGVYVANTTGIVSASLHTSAGSATIPTTNVGTTGFVSGNSTVSTATNMAIANTAGNTTINTNSIGSSWGYSVNSTVMSFAGGNVSATSANLAVLNAVISGNLYVQGTLTSINTTNLNINDNIIALADLNSPNYVAPSTTLPAGVVADVVDVGFVGSAPIQTATNITANTTNGSANIQIASTTGFYVGELITGTNIPANTVITTVNLANVIISQVATGTSAVGTANAYYTGFYGLARVATSNTFSLFVSNTQIANPANPSPQLGAVIGATTTPMPLTFLGVTSTQTGVVITANSTVNVNITANTLSLSTALGAGSGGTGTGTYAAGDLLYSSATNVLSKLGITANGNVLQVINNLPAWGGIDGGTF